MGVQESKTLKDRWVAQQKYVVKNRKKDKRKDLVSATRIEELTMQINLEYPFLASINDSAVLTDHQLPDEPIIFCNDEFTDLTGYRKEEILGRNCRFLQGKYTQKSTTARIRNALETGTKVEIEILNYRKDGVPFYNSFVMLPLHMKGRTDGPVANFIAIQKDVTVLVNPFAKPMVQWTIPEVCMWLDKHNSSSYISSFMEKQVSGTVLDKMTATEMESLGIVLGSEQSRLLQLIAQQSRDTHHDNSYLKSEMSENVMESTEDDSNVSSYSASVMDRHQRGTSRGRSIRSKKVAVDIAFEPDVRPSVRLVLPSASATRKQMSKVLAKKFGRPYDLLEMKASSGLKSSLTLKVKASFAGLHDDMFVLLDGVNTPVLVTDNVAIVVYANTALWEELGLDDDPAEKSVATLIRVAGHKSGDLPYLRKLTSDLKVTTLNGKRAYQCSMNEVRMSTKHKFHVWSFRRTALRTPVGADEQNMFAELSSVYDSE